jgi:cysteinyl-tRNA synthetase
VQLAAERQSARERKDWAASDEYRKQLTALGWTVQDTPDGPKLIKS